MNKILIFFVIWGYFHWYPKLILRSINLRWKESLIRACGLCIILQLILFVQWGLDLLWGNPISRIFRMILKWFL